MRTTMGPVKNEQLVFDVDCREAYVGVCVHVRDGADRVVALENPACVEDDAGRVRVCRGAEDPAAPLMTMRCPGTVSLTSNM